MLSFLLWLIVILAIVFVFGSAAWLLVSAFLRQRSAEADAPPLGEIVTVETPHGTGRLHALIKGEAQPGRRPIVLIHGAGGNLRHFTQTILDPLAQTDRVLAVDRPGSGYSVAPGPESMSLVGQADFIRRGALQLGFEKPVVVGHSFGGSVALAWALDHPDDVSALVLLAPGAYPFKPKPPASDAVVMSPAMRRILSWTILGPAVLKQRGEIHRATFGPQKPPVDFSTTSGGALSVRPSQLMASLEEQAIYQAGLKMLSTRYAELALPITVLFGAEDGVVDAAAHAAPLARAARATTVEILPGVGHMVPYAAPEKTIEAIRAAAAAP
ncbi:MAG: alpha/beta hydrolase [Pseudomonadota bacterium]